jgi:sugar lactone lactonase YvrE
MTATTSATTQNVQARFRWQTPPACAKPNGLQAVESGVWVVDQQRESGMYLLDWRDGQVLRSFATKTNHSSGVAWDGEAVWVASTYPPVELFRFSIDGEELRRLPTPGASETKAAHGLEWIDGALWVCVPPRVEPPRPAVYRVDPQTGRVLSEFAAPGMRPHGLAWDGHLLWVAETTLRTITAYTLDGRPQRVLELAAGPAEGPDPHGLTYYRGELWYCDAATRAMCTIAL